MSNARDKANIPALNFSSTGIDDNATSTAITIDSSERVGIGTTSPTSLLAVEGTSVIADFKSTNNNNVIRIKGNNATNGVAIGSTSSDDFVFTTNVSERMRIQNSTGNVGIGTSSPSRKLHVVSATGTAQIQSTTTASTLYFGDTNSTSIDAQGIGSLGTNLYLMTGGLERMRIDSSGNVGIGATSITTLGSNHTTLQINGTSIDRTGALRLRSSNDSVDTALWASTTSTYLATISNHPLQFRTNNTERMRIDSSGNVGIGITNPNANLNIVQASNTQKLLRLRNNTADTSNGDGFTVEISDASSPVCTLDHVSGGNDASLAFSTNRTERMRINSSGRVLIGTTTAQRNNREKVEVNTTTGEAYLAMTNGLSYAGFAYRSLQSTGGTHYIAWFENSSGTNVGEITHNNSSTSYVTSSDYRLKENVNYDFDATSRLKQLKPARFNFIVNPDTTVDGFLAHEVSSIVPEAITGEKDAVDKNGNPVYQGIDQSKLVPLLVKTIQELEARITTLENK